MSEANYQRRRVSEIRKSIFRISEPRTLGTSRYISLDPVKSGSAGLAQRGFNRVKVFLSSPCSLTKTNHVVDEL